MAEFNPCLIVPIYNHHDEFTKIVPELVECGIPCLLVDDGSKSETQKALDALVIQYPGSFTLIRLAVNQGKGGAVCEAIHRAKQLGFSHALQIDSDGQHNPKYIPEFLQVSQRYPQAVVCGTRPYEAMPKGRRYGRLLTDFWVWVNTISFDIKDSMSGYRLYPLKETDHLLSKKSIGRRMDFDTDILVRLYWMGLEVKQFDIEVVYQDDIASHFDLVNDNIRITKMHTRLFFGMLVRLPKLIFRKFR